MAQDSGARHEDASDPQHEEVLIEGKGHGNYRVYAQRQPLRRVEDHPLGPHLERYHR